MTLIQCAQVVCAVFVVLGILATTRAGSRLFDVCDEIGDFLMLAVVCVIAFVAILISGLVAALSLVLVHRDRKRPEFTITVDPRNATQLEAAAALARRISSIRHSRGVDRHGRLLPTPRAARGLSELPYAQPRLGDPRSYSIDKQAG